MDLQEGEEEKRKPRGALDSDKNHWALFVNVKKLHVILLRQPWEETGVSGERKIWFTVYWKIKLIFISCCTHVQIHHRSYIQATQTHRALPQMLHTCHRHTQMHTIHAKEVLPIHSTPATDYCVTSAISPKPCYKGTFTPYLQPGILSFLYHWGTGESTYAGWKVL